MGIINILRFTRKSRRLFATSFTLDVYGRFFFFFSSRARATLKQINKKTKTKNLNYTFWNLF